MGSKVKPPPEAINDLDAALWRRCDLVLCCPDLPEFTLAHHFGKQASAGDTAIMAIEDWERAHNKKHKPVAEITTQDWPEFCNTLREIYNKGSVAQLYLGFEKHLFNHTRAVMQVMGPREIRSALLHDDATEILYESEGIRASFPRLFTDSVRGLHMRIPFVDLAEQGKPLQWKKIETGLDPDFIRHRQSYHDRYSEICNDR